MVNGTIGRILRPIDLELVGMKYVWECRRTFIALFGMVVLAGLSAYNGMDSSTAISAIAIGVAGANAAEKGWKAQASKKYTSGE